MQQRPRRLDRRRQPRDRHLVHRRHRQPSELTAADGPGPFEVTVSLGGCTESAQTTVEWWPVPVIGPLPDTVIHCVLDQPEVVGCPGRCPRRLVGLDGKPGRRARRPRVGHRRRLHHPHLRQHDRLRGHRLGRGRRLAQPRCGGCADAGIVCWGEETEVIGELRAVEGTNLDEIPYTLLV